MKVKFEKRSILKEKPSLSELRFGKYMSDYMFVMDYDGEWKDARIVPYDSIELEPSSIVFHYAIETFEGMKAYRKNNEIYLFRPKMHAKRFNRTNARLCMPTIDEELFVEILHEFLKVEKDWIPNTVGYSLYLRPFMIGIDPSLGVKKSRRYKFIVIASPVCNYYFKGNDLIDVYVEDSYVRSVLGGTGDIKCGGNYASTILVQKKAYDLGYQQVLWLDGIHKKYVEEVGTMNIFFVIDHKVYTPALTGSILPGITRDSIISILKDKGIEVIEKNIDIHDLMKAIEDKRVLEAFGCGTAALITPIQSFTYKDKKGFISTEIGPIANMLYDELTNIQWGLTEDKRNWNQKIKQE